MNLWYRFIVATLSSLLRLFYRFHVELPVSNYPKAAIIAPNHASFLDPPVVASVCREEVHFLARSSLFRKKWWAFFLKRLNTHPLDGSLQDLASLRSIVDLLRKGNKVVLFPEGGRTETGDLQGLKMGAAMLALRAGVPIIPVFIQGTFDAWPRHSFWPKWGMPIYCIFGEPIFPPPSTKHMQRKEIQLMLLKKMEEALKELKNRADQIR